MTHTPGLDMVQAGHQRLPLQFNCITSAIPFKGPFNVLPKQCPSVTHTAPMAALDCSALRPPPPPPPPGAQDDADFNEERVAMLQRTVAQLDPCYDMVGLVRACVRACVCLKDKRNKGAVCVYI